MKVFIIFTSIIYISLICTNEARECRRFVEFRCFWSGDCIPVDLVCDGKHDCPGGEDETKWDAKCKPCKGQFHCHKETDRVSCIDKKNTCDGYEHCLNGEDETIEYARCTKTCLRDELKANLKGRRGCRKPCKKQEDCKDGKECICDYDCGMSCVSVGKTCPALKIEDVPNLKSIRYVRRDRKSKVITNAVEPYTYDVQAHHTCEPGFIALPDNIRLCHGRGSDNETWTKTVVCAPNCDDRKENVIKAYKLTCGIDCIIEADCPAGKACTCDGACGRTCVNLEIECPDAPPAENAYIEYTGEKFERVAHYICNEGTFRVKGSVARKCTGSGVWDGTLIVCEPVYCGDPVRGIFLMRGRVQNYISPPYSYNTTLQFACAFDQRLLGSEERTCMGNGRWSGHDTVCDNLGTLERCPHPGIPIDGEIVGSSADEDFLVGKKVRFRCHEGLVMIGEAVQTCLFFKDWSGGGAPQCVDPRYSDSPAEVIGKLSWSTSNIRPSIKSNGLGRTIYTNAPGGNEVYFLIDLSLSVGAIELKNTISFAVGLVKRLSLNDTSQVTYGIIVFATFAKIHLNIHEVPKKTPKEVIKLLEDVDKDYRNLRDDVKLGTNIQEALHKLDREMLAFSYEHDEDHNVKRHCFVLTDGQHNAGGSPVAARIRIENAYADNPPEFYSITSAAGDEDPEARQELQELATEQKNFIYVEDFYKLHNYVDQVTDAREDFSPCGQAGDVGSVRKLASIGRVIGGTKAVERAWPWQALIADYDEDIRVAFHQMRGGGSLINKQWVLTAAHVFADDDGESWWENIMVALGVIRRPQKFNQLQGSVKMYQPEKIYKHENFVGSTFENDIALIKIGGEYIVSADGKRIEFPGEKNGEVTLTPYIRPVCLPCDPNSCVGKVLMKQDAEGKVLLTGNEPPEEKCRIEYEFLTSKNKKDRVAVVATGFGHNATREDDDEKPLKLSEYLQQGLLELLPKEGCEEGIKAINKQKAIPGFEHVFTEQMICAVGVNTTKVIDTCKGDSGGPIVRQVRDEKTKESCFVQLGIVSYGYGCGQRFRGANLGEKFFPGFYANVSSFVGWIATTMEQHVPPVP